MKTLQVKDINLKSIKAENRWNKEASDETIAKTIVALGANGIDAQVVESGQEAKNALLSLIPKGAEVMTNTSVTLDAFGITKEINESGNFDAIKPKLMAMNRETQGREMKKMGAAPDWAVGSVHAVTEDGKVVIASNTGSQLSGYAYAAERVVWVIGSQKIVNDINEAIERINEYSLPLEAERANKAYGVPGSFVSKMLIINQELVPGRIKMIIVKQAVGF